jgi:hypothetical protein
MALASDVLNKDSNGRWGYVAREKMKRWGEGAAASDSLRSR